MVVFLEPASNFCDEGRVFVSEKDAELFLQNMTHLDLASGFEQLAPHPPLWRGWLHRRRGWLCLFGPGQDV